MNEYDALAAPLPEEWLALDEKRRLSLIEQYHECVAANVPNLRMHAVIHTVVENQLALGIAPVCEALDRLLSGGLDRHDAVHAIGSVLAEHIFDLLHTEVPSDPTERYYKAIRKLTVKSWRKNAR